MTFDLHTVPEYWSKDVTKFVVNTHHVKKYSTWTGQGIILDGSGDETVQSFHAELVGTSTGQNMDG